MFFIFGWGVPRHTDHGAVELRKCPHCHNERRWHLVETTSWFTLFFIPIFSTGRRWELLCPICDFGYELTDEQAEAYQA